MRQTDGVILEAIYYDVVCTSSAVVRVLHARRLPASTYEADAVIGGQLTILSLYSIHQNNNNL